MVVPATGASIGDIDLSQLIPTNQNLRNKPMNPQSVKCCRAIVMAAVLLFAPSALLAQSSYSNAVMSLNPAGYWPLQENVQVPPSDIETNYGSLGSIANGYYGCTNAQHGIPSPFTGDTCINFDGNSGGFLGVPTTDHRISLTAGQPFTIECWTYQTGTGAYYGLVSQTGPNNDSGLNGPNGGSGGTDAAGYSLNQDFAAYRGATPGAPNSPACFTFHVYNGNGLNGGAEVEVTNTGAGEWFDVTNANGGPGFTNCWVYYAAVYDGTNCWLYMYSTNLSAAYSGTNGTVYQVPITSAGGQAYFGAPTLLGSAAFEPDVWDPLQIGATRGLSGNEEHGYMAQVAIYTNALTSTQIANDYSAGTNGLGNYDATIIGNNPYMYWKMNAPAYVLPPTNTWPVANNYGSLAGVMSNDETTVVGANCGVYQPGTLPGVAGAPLAGFGPFTNACAFNGIRGAVDAGFNGLLDGTNATTSYTILGWFQGNPMDAGSRYQAPIGHYNSSWTVQIQNGTFMGYRPATGTATASIAPATYNINNGNWHMFAVVFNAASSQLSDYLDSGAVSTSVANSGSVNDTLHQDIFIGVTPNPSYQNPLVDTTFTSGAEYFAGRLAQMSFFTNALSLSQIEGLYYSAQGTNVIITQPISAAVNVGADFTNLVVGAGLVPFSYQWYTNGVAIAGATNASLILNAVSAANASPDYYVVLTNIYGAVTSSVASLTVYTVPAFTSELPQTYTNLFTLYPGVSPVFSVQTAGPQPITCQWFTNNVLDGADTATSLTLSNVVAAFTNVYCVADNSYGYSTSMVWSAQIAAMPTNSSGGLAPYPQVVMSLNPIGYWRLNEPDCCGGENGPNNFAVCHDYAGGNDGLYTNMSLGWPGYNPTTDPSDTSAQFGEVDENDDSVDSYAGSIAGINFSAPSNTSVAFTVTAWANGYVPTYDAGIVTLGWGGGGEQFDMDTGADPGHNFRFLMRDAGGNAHTINSAIAPANDTTWYYLVGVVDEITNHLVSFYINGSLVGTSAIGAGSGVLTATNAALGETSLMSIGSRMSAEVTNFNFQFYGNINDVAIFNYALSSNQVQQIFLTNGIPPSFTVVPAGGSVDSGANLVVPAAATGTPKLSYAWFDVGANKYISGQTNATLVVSNDTASDSYYLTVSNPYGSTNSSTIFIDVVSGIPSISGQPQNPFYGIAGETTTNLVSVFGSIPISYQWQYSNSVGWVNLSGYRFSGAQNNNLVISDTYPSDAGFYQLVITNVYGAVTSSPAQLIVIGVPLGFNTAGPGGSDLFWTANLASTYNNGVLTLTTSPPTSDGTASYFCQVPQYIGAFEASFTYEALYAGSQPMADGTTFCLQDDPRGASAVGLGGGDLAVAGSAPGNPPVSGNTIIPSVELELNIYPGNGVGGMGYAVATNGVIGQTTPPGSVVLTNIPVDVTIYYANGQMALTFSNEISGATYNSSVNVGDITKVLGTNTALVGFTGSYGGDYSIQTITNFSFVSLANAAIAPNGNNVVVSWPDSIAGYSLQQSASLASGNWVNVTNPVTVVNGQNEVIVPNSGAAMFYRLVLLQ